MPRQASHLTTVSIYIYVFLPFAAGHFISYILRTINAVLAPVFTTELSLDAREIGLVTSAYFLTFAIAQLPVGLALDRFGPRRVQTMLLTVAAAGCVLFAQVSSFPALALTRGLIGLGLAACFMSALKAVAQWVPPARMPSINGALLAVGGLGAMASTLPVQLAVEAFGWRSVFLLLAALIAMTSVAIHQMTPEPVEATPRKPASIRSLVEVYRNKAFLRTIGVMLIPHMAFFGLQGLWVGAWLHDAAGIGEREVGVLLLIGMAATVVGALAVGHIVEYADKRGVKPLDIAAVGLLGFLAVQIAIVADARWLAPALAIAFPLLGSFAGLEFTIVAQSVPPSLTGRASTCLNLLIFTGSFLMQAGFGAILDLWTPSASGGGYPADAYRVAFAVAMLLQMPGLLAWLWGKRRLPEARRLAEQPDA